ncbi:50S ribosomal protein P1 [Candidatus Woesearchaeota archaeon]|jgi:large subunit ribosomal protein L12|nr:50S ribosomal protein P1 [Candidatus Woesearchaeota archaeon]MBT6734852.1 50S ribosomal protein P1 [Candidatus Woesearchaeota archaeon]MBT7169633.1 50S ribosomal protein P1 [Candidatus Woesearchaeota archaeon]MBT7474591.1 50S ribosomal protein P1 [Candidatus Woesearchaeota archaeon]
MELIYAALLIHKAGNEVNEENLKKVLASAGAKADDSKIKALVAALDGVDIEQAIKEAATVSAAPVATATEEAPAKEEEKKEEKKVDGGQAAAGLGALFG